MNNNSVFNPRDIKLFNEGMNYQLYSKMGAHLTVENNRPGVHFALWAPNAVSVSVLTDSNNWNPAAAPMTRTEGGIWEVFIPGIKKGDYYKYAVTGADRVTRYKADPYAFLAQKPPLQASVVWDMSRYEWTDGNYRADNKADDAPLKAMSVYEVYLGSWKKDGGSGEEGFKNYRQLGDELAEYLSYMGYTHVELMGICEFPFEGSWGYQVTGYYAPTARYGDPEDFKYLVNRLHSAGIGVILDWVPAHFPKDSFGLENFDGTPLYESGDPLLSEYPEWGTYAFDHSKPQVRSFLISSACYWLNEYHVDALRVDAVAAMLYMSSGRSSWRTNEDGSTDNHASIAFLKQLNKAVADNTGGYLIAEDSSIMKGITEAVDKGGMGFKFKWNMGWMNDMLRYFQRDPVYRSYHHDEITRVIDYSFLENFILVISHDEVVHLKKPMLGKMPGSTGDKLAGLKAFYACQYTYPGKKLLFMGQEFAEDREWDENRQINWALADNIWHRDVMESVRRLNMIYRKYPCLYTDTGDPTTFEWIKKDDSERSILSYIRRNPWNYNGALVIICNFTPESYRAYSFGVPLEGLYKRVFSTYDTMPGESITSENAPPLTAVRDLCDARKYRITYDLRPYEVIILEMPAMQ